MTKQFIFSNINTYWYTRREKWHIFNGYILSGTSGRGTCSCRRSREVTRSTTLSLSTGPTARWTSYHQLLHYPLNQTVKSKHSSLHMFGLALIYIRVNQASRHADFLHTQTLAQMCLGTSNMNLSESQIGRGNAGEGRIIWKWFNSLWLTFCINWQNA